MNHTSEISPSSALRAAIERAQNLPKCKGSIADPSTDMWDHDGVWLGDWGKSEPSDSRLEIGSHPEYVPEAN
jgi:hypothetical protein